jgi:hypothetical protein
VGAEDGGAGNFQDGSRVVYGVGDLHHLSAVLGEFESSVYRPIRLWLTKIKSPLAPTIGFAAAVLLHNAADFVSFAASNSQVDAIGAVFAEARDELRILIERHESKWDEALYRKLRHRTQVMDSLAQVEI